LTDSITARHPALRGCLESLGRCEKIVRQIPPELFAGSDDFPHPVGPHLRHCLEHVTCFLDGWEKGEVDYDARVREEPLERDPEYFLAALDRTRAALERVPDGIFPDELLVRQTPALDSDRIPMRSTIEREFVFLSSHTIHHVALVRHICLSAGIELPQDTGFAFSTAVHQQAVSG
jgi:hypothetical protein